MRTRNLVILLILIAAIAVRFMGSDDDIPTTLPETTTTLVMTTATTTTTIAENESSENGSDGGRERVIFFDDAEGGGLNWQLDGFYVSEEKFKSYKRSFYSGTGNNYRSNMTLSSPLSLPAGEAIKLNFWTYYDIHRNLDFAYLEISEDKEYWTVIDTYTNIYQPRYKTYDLSDYAGTSVYLRFRYETNPIQPVIGIYVDDIKVYYNV